MNPILLVLALLFLIPIIKEIRIFILIKLYSERIIGRIISIESKEIFTRNLEILIFGGKHKSINISYEFIFQSKKRKVLNDEIQVTASSSFNKLKKGDNIDIFVYSKNHEIKNTWLIKKTFLQLFPFIMMFLLLLIVAYLSKKM